MATLSTNHRADPDDFRELLTGFLLLGANLAPKGTSRLSKPLSQTKSWRNLGGACLVDLVKMDQDRPESTNPAPVGLLHDLVSLSNLDSFRTIYFTSSERSVTTPVSDEALK